MASSTTTVFSTTALIFPFRPLPLRIPHQSLRLHRHRHARPLSLSSRLRYSPSPIAAASSSSSYVQSPNGGAWRADEEEEELESGFLGRLRMGIAALRTVLPGGSWWRIEEVAGEAGNGSGGGGGVTVGFALRRMWELMGNDRWIVFAGFTALVAAVVSDMSIPNFLAASIFSAQKGDNLLFHRNTRLLILLCFTSGICSGLRSFSFGIANMILVKRMREKLFSSLLLQDISFFDSKTVGELTSRLGADCQQVSRVIGYDLNLISRDTLQATAALLFLFTLSWRLALSTMVICLTLSTIMFFHGRFQKRVGKSAQDCTAKANEVSQEAISLVKTVRVYGTEKQEFARYLEWLKKLADITLRQSFVFGFWSLSLGFFYHSTQVFAVLIGGASVMAGHISAEQLTKFVFYSEWLIYSTWRLADNWSSLLQAIGASEKVFQTMNLSPSRQFLTKGLELQKLAGHIEFVDVSFSYPSRTTMRALRHVNLTVFPGEVLAVVGLSGSGKSTLVNLLLGLYKPTGGQILIDGCFIEELNIKWLREKVGYVGQEPRLFRMDVNSNIRYGCTRGIDNEDVQWAAKQAFAHDFIMSLPNGYHTLVDDALLSGGQKQRIAIARAIIRDPTILIMDEATSALDAESEHYVKGVMRAVQSGSKTRRTVIVIAHRLSTIRAADRIIVMDGGSIVEMGSHRDLLSKDGIYAQLTKRQADAFS